MIYFSADLHLGHARILGLTTRPFSNVEDMDAAIIRSWKQKIRPKDTVYILGDYSFHPDKYTGMLPGRKILIRGNHDPKHLPEGEFEEVHDVLMLNWNHHAFWLSHYPHRIWPQMHHGARHLFGHVHNEMRVPVYGSMDVGVDSIGLYPISIEEVLHRVPEPDLEILRSELLR